MTHASVPMNMHQGFEGRRSKSVRLNPTQTPFVLWGPTLPMSKIRTVCHLNWISVPVLENKAGNVSLKSGD